MNPRIVPPTDGNQAHGESGAARETLRVAGIGNRRRHRGGLNTTFEFNSASSRWSRFLPEFSVQVMQGPLGQQPWDLYPENVAPAPQPQPEQQPDHHSSDQEASSVSATSPLERGDQGVLSEAEKFSEPRTAEPAIQN